MQLTDGLLLVSASLHGAAGVFYALLHRATRRPEYRAFARFAGSLCVYILANAAWGANGPANVLTGAVVWSSGSIAAAALLETSRCLTAGIPPSRLELRVWYGAALALSFSTVTSSVLLEDAPGRALRDFPETPVAATVMAVQSVVVFSGLGAAVWSLFRAARERAYLRIIVAGFSVGVVLGALDEVIRWVSGVRPHISEHSGVFMVIGTTLALADRQVRFASELAEKNRDLSEAHEALVQTQRERGRQEPLAALGELSAVVAHEVRNPLAIVKNAVSSLRRPALGSEDRKVLLDIIGEEAVRLSRLARDLLAFARPGTVLQREVTVATWVHRAVRDATRESAELVSRIHVELTGPEQLTGDCDLLRLALANVVENALHATEEGGYVRISSRAALCEGHEGLAICVDDDGPGMPPEVAAKAHQPFFTTRATGTGLGLAIVDRVVRSHAGTLDLRSALGEGSTVTLTLPLSRPDGPLSPSMVSAPSAAHGGETRDA